MKATSTGRMVTHFDNFLLLKHTLKDLEICHELMFIYRERSL